MNWTFPTKSHGLLNCGYLPTLVKSRKILEQMWTSLLFTITFVFRKFLTNRSEIVESGWKKSLLFQDQKNTPGWLKIRLKSRQVRHVRLIWIMAVSDASVNEFGTKDNT